MPLSVTRRGVEPPFHTKREECVGPVDVIDENYGPWRPPFPHGVELAGREPHRMVAVVDVKIKLLTLLRNDLEAVAFGSTPIDGRGAEEP